MKPVKKWVGSVGYCNLCHNPIVECFVDGTVRNGGWATMCVECHAEYGLGLGMGRGQKYQKQEDGSWLKVEG